MPHSFRVFMLYDPDYQKRIDRIWWWIKSERKTLDPILILNDNYFDKHYKNMSFGAFECLPLKRVRHAFDVDFAESIYM